MSLSQTLQNAINEQINAELFSAYLYLSMAAYCESINLGGFAHWMRLQNQEETGHAMKFFDFVIDRGGRVELKPIEQPPLEFDSPLRLMQQTLAHEQKVTGLINRLYALAVKEGDYAAQVMLQWFITEQVEEEKSATDIIEQLKTVGADGTGLLMIDAKLGARTANASV